MTSGKGFARRWEREKSLKAGKWRWRRRVEWRRKRGAELAVKTHSWEWKVKYKKNFKGLRRSLKVLYVNNTTSSLSSPRLYKNIFSKKKGYELRESEWKVREKITQFSIQESTQRQRRQGKWVFEKWMDLQGCHWCFLSFASFGGGDP